MVQPSVKSEELGHERLTIATMATDTPMGAQHYQERIASGAQAALDDLDPGGWTARRLVFRSLRSPLPGDRRMPVRWASNAGARSRRALGRMLYGTGVTHRMSLELPPAAHGDVVTLHDVVAWRYPDESAPVPAARAELADADAVICVSQFTADEASTFLGLRNAHVVHNGVDERYFDAEPLSHAALAELGVPEEFVLHAGGAGARKNLEALAEAWPRVQRQRPGLALVLAGPQHPRRDTLFRGMPGVHLTGRLPDEVMPGLISRALAVVVPSLYEGFGLPALEAMAANTPLVAADTSALPEVVGDGGILVAPTGAGLYEGLMAASSGDAALGALVVRGRARAEMFTWNRSAEGHARVWTSLR